ncbi:MAG: hypothetical protein ABIU77_08010, partial [Ferruginibacter sp.]
MGLLFLSEIVGEMIQALSWTLVHSLWQGMLLSVIAAIIVFATRNTSPQVRYNLLTAALLVFIVAVSTTFCLQLVKAKQLIDTAPFVPADQTQITPPALQPMQAENKLSIMDTMVAFVDSHANNIVMAWLLIIALQLIRLSADLYG